MWFQLCATDQAQQRVATERHGEPCGQARSGLTTQREAEMTLKIAQASRPSSPRRRNLGQTLGEDPPWAADTQAVKSPGPHLNADGTPLPRQIGQGAVIMAV